MPERKPRPPRHELLHPPKQIKEMAADYGVSYQTLWKWRRAAGATCQTNGEAHWNSKLTRTDAELIRDLYAQGLMQKEIAEKFDVAPNTVHNIIHFATWY